jgi:hypothetical protein
MTINLDDLDFLPIDSPQLELPPFGKTILTLGEWLISRDKVRNLSEHELSKLMVRHSLKLKIRAFSVREIRDQLHKYPGQIRGAGIQVEWQEVSPYMAPRTPAHYTFSFSRIFREDHTQDGQDEPV